MSAPRIPRDLADVDAAWLSAVLGADVVAVHPGGDVVGIPVTSRVARLRLERGSASGPERVVVKLARPEWSYGPELYQREVAFYRDFAPGASLPIPDCYYADYDPGTGAFVLVLQDLGDAQPGVRLDGLTEAEADAVIDGVADLHRAWWGRPELAGLEVRGHSPERVAETLQTLDERWAALQQCGKYPIDDALRDAVPRVMERYAEGMLAISSEPHTLIHSDLHVENFALEQTADGLRLIAFDWQNARHGNCAFDVSHVIASVQPQLVAGAYDRLLARYHARLAPPDYPLARLRAHVAASIRHQFVGSANWYATTEAETLRDARTLRGHWARLCAAVVAVAG